MLLYENTFGGPKSNNILSQNEPSSILWLHVYFCCYPAFRNCVISPEAIRVNLHNVYFAHLAGSRPT